MKCGIVTVYNSENCGSFLQAYALMRAIQGFGHHSICVEHCFDDHSSSIRQYRKQLLKMILKMRFKGVNLWIKRRKTFREAISDIRLSSADKDFECYVLGSDTVWDISRKYFYNHHTFFWGTQFENAKIISYAPSVGFSKKEDIEKCGFIRDALHNMSTVSVRDKTSKELIQPYCDKEIEIVCDPTYLIDRTEYNAIAKPTNLKDFLFIYYYGIMPSDYREAIQVFAKDKGLKTVTFGSTNPWCDISLAYAPLLFLSIYDKADYIITNTFHGTVFATIYEKKFAVIKNDKPKVLDVLEMCAMSDKMTKTAEDISAILHSDFDYETTRRRIKEERENGLNYLKDALESCGENG